MASRLQGRHVEHRRGGDQDDISGQGEDSGGCEGEEVLEANEDVDDGGAENNDEHSSDEYNDEPADAHSEYGACPFGHDDRGLGPDCLCDCDSCRNTQDRPENYDFLRGYFKRPMRVKHPYPPSPTPNVRRSCTEMIPWNTNVDNWTDPCPHSRTQTGDQSAGQGNEYPREIRMCCEAGEMSGDCLFPGMDELEMGQYPPGNPDAEDSDEEYTRFVCQDHIEDSNRFWELEKFHKAHLVGTCREHREELKAQWPQGLNTCTCPRLFDSWQCRRCFERKIFRVQNHFRRRVAALHKGGGVYEREIFKRDYHLRWRNVRALVAREHPCHHSCGNKRILSNEEVMDCRACGGMIIQARPKKNPLLRLFAGRDRYSFRFAGEPLLQLNEKGQPTRIGGQPAIPSPISTPPSSDNDDSDDGDEVPWSKELRDEDEEREFRLYNERSSRYKNG